MLERPKILKKAGKKREGKGFSREELKKAGVSLSEAVRLHVPVDPRRKTVHEDNIEVIKVFLDRMRKAAKPKQKKPEKKPEKKTERKSKS